MDMLTDFKIFLRALEVSDYETINDLRDDEGVFSNIMGNKYYISKEREKKWIGELFFDDTKIYWAICLNTSNKLIGFCCIADIDWRNRKAKVGGMTINNEYRNKGFGIESLKLIMNYVFNELGLNRLTIVYKKNNKITEHGINKLGFKKELLLRENIYKQGKFQNVVKVAILESEYRKQIKNEG